MTEANESRPPEMQRGTRLRISDVRVHLVSCPYPEERQWSMGYGKARKRDEVFVIIETDEGVSGIGEAYHAFAPRIVASIIETHLKPILLGKDPFATDELWHHMFFGTLQLGSGAVAAISGVDMALWDIMGKALRQPVYRLLGGAGTTRVPAYVGCQCLGWQPPDTLAEEASGYVAQGYQALKVRGGQGIRKDVEAVAAVREAVGPDIDVMIDANSMYTWPDAVQLAKKLEEHDTFWLEDPFDFTVKYHQGEMGRLRTMTTTPICSGGNVYTRFQYRDMLALGGVDYVTPDVGKCGGISEGLKIAHMASSQNVLVAPHASPGLDMVASLHLCAAVPQHVMAYLEWDAAPFNPPRDEMLTHPIEVDNGDLLLSDRPGLGTELNLDALEAYPFIEGSAIGLEPRRRRWQVPR